MPYYHATRDRHLPSIRRHGLGGLLVEPNWPDCLTGVYLAENPAVAVSFLIEHILKHAPTAQSPREELASWIVIVVDDARVDRMKLSPDPQVGVPGVWLYSAVLDVTNAVVVAVTDLFSTDWAGPR